MTNPQYIEALKQGNETAFATLVEEHQTMVFNTAIGLLQSNADADDVTQEVFIKVFEGIKNFRQEASLKTWIYRITVNKSLDFLRAKKGLLGFIFPQEKHLENALDFNHPGVELDKKENAALLFKAIKHLPEKQKAAFVLQKLEGLTVAEIAGVLQTSNAAVDSLLSRAKNNLQKKLQLTNR